MILSIGGKEVSITSSSLAGYWTSVVLSVVLIRVILASFKVWAMKDGEHRPDMN